MNMSSAVLPRELGGSVDLATTAPQLQLELDGAVQAAACVLQQGATTTTQSAVIGATQRQQFRVQDQGITTSSTSPGGGAQQSRQGQNQFSTNRVMSQARRLLYWSFGDLGIITSWQHLGSTLARGKRKVVSTLRRVLDKVTSAVLAITV